MQFDVVVVGAGSAGCVMAARLSEDPDRQVLLLEAGPVPRRAADFPADLLAAGSVRGADPAHPRNWAYPATLAPGHPYSIARGRIAGGSSTINGGYFMRARRADFDRWSAGGNDAWRYDRVLPLLRAIERDLDFGASELHGDRGPIPVRRPRLDHPAAEAFQAATAESGIPDEPDKNGEQSPGFGPVPTNALDGVRWNAALGYLLPAADRPNLTVRGDSPVRRVVFERGRAVGVESYGRIIRADQVILCAGAIGSAHLLLLSGIGPAAELERHRVTVVHDAVGVGAAFDDHPQVVLDCRPRRPLPLPHDCWMAGSLNAEAADGTLEVLQSLVPMETLVFADAADSLPLLVSVQLATPAGRLGLTAADPDVPPLLDYGYGGDTRRRLSSAVQLTLELLATPAFSAVLAAPELGFDLGGWIGANLRTSLHTCGTAPFGRPDAVVDQYGSVLGVDGLRVADLSILPSAPSRGPAVTAILVGEVVAESVRACGRA